MIEYETPGALLVTNAVDNMVSSEVVTEDACGNVVIAAKVGSEGDSESPLPPPQPCNIIANVIAPKDTRRFSLNIILVHL